MAQVSPTFDFGEILSGQQLNPQAGFVAPFVEQVVPYYEFPAASGIFVTGYEEDPYCEITPIDAHSATVRIYNTAFIEEILAGTYEIAQTTITRVDLPDVLTALTTTFNASSGTGSDSHPASQQSFEVFGTGSGGINPSSTAQGSASILIDVTPAITERFNTNVPATEYTFYMPSGATKANIIAKLVSLGATGVQYWPQFRPQPIVLTLKGQQASVSTKADTNVSGGGSMESGQVGYSYGNGYSREGGVTVTTKIIPPTLHAAITIANTTQTLTASAAVDASTPDLFVGSVAEQGSISNSTSQTMDATASIAPTSISATTPTSIPTSGLYIYSLSPGPSEFGQIIFQAIVIDFADLT